MKVAYISHAGRPCYELEWFSRLPVEELRIIDVDFSKYPLAPDKRVTYCKVDSVELPFFHSTAHLVRYKNYRHYLDDVDVIVVLEAFSSLSSQFVTFCRRAKKPIVVLTYELIAKHPVYKLPFFRSFTRNTFQHATKFIAVTGYAKQHLIQLGVPEQRIEIVHPGIDCRLFSSDDRKKALGEGGVVFVGRLERHKGIDVVLQTFHEVIKNHPGRSLTIIGDGSYRKAVEELAQTEKNLLYLARVDNDKIPELLNQSSVFIMPARDTYRLGRKIGAEQFCFAIAEAMACGLKIVAFDCGAIKEVAGTSNYICRQDRPGDLIGLVDVALDRKDLLLIQKNKSTAKKLFDINKQAIKFYEALEKLVP